MGLTRTSSGSYKLTGKTTEADVLAAAEGILKAKLERQGSIGNPSDAADFLRMRLWRCHDQAIGPRLPTRGERLASLSFG